MTANNCYIITEYCSEGDLAGQLKKHGRFGETAVLPIIRDIFNGFKELVRRKILHRDLKPSNILVQGGEYKIADFGFAKYEDGNGAK